MYGDTNNSRKLSKIMTCYRPFETRPILRWGIHSDYQKCSQVNFLISMAYGSQVKNHIRLNFQNGKYTYLIADSESL